MREQRALAKQRLIIAEQWNARHPRCQIAKRLAPGVRCVDRLFWQPTAEAVGRLALRQYLAGRRGDAFQLTPDYFRRSAAEEKLAQLDRITQRRTVMLGMPRIAEVAGRLAADGHR